MYFAGHVHVYERQFLTTPIGQVVSSELNDYINPDAPIYII
jgi:hypothetical protein